MRGLLIGLGTLALVLPVARASAATFAPEVERDILCAADASKFAGDDRLDEKSRLAMVSQESFFLGRLSGRDDRHDWLPEVMQRPKPKSDEKMTAEFMACIEKMQAVMMDYHPKTPNLPAPTPKAP